ncbi:MAG TPA: tRNA-modifying protein YgfZ, partial [Steroidobacteraceae bacterium]
VSFTKGCYTGQEVIARAHYRGRVKRRMQRFETLAAASLAPGDAGQLEDGRGFRVVESVVRADGCSEFLAVAPLPATHGAESDAEPVAAPAAATATAFTRARALPLPYPLPD